MIDSDADTSVPQDLACGLFELQQQSTARDPDSDGEGLSQLRLPSAGTQTAAMSAAAASGKVLVSEVDGGSSSREDTKDDASLDGSTLSHTMKKPAQMVTGNKRIWNDATKSLPSSYNGAKKRPASTGAVHAAGQSTDQNG